MVWIASSGNLTSNTANVTFSSIPATFTHLQLRVFARGTTSFSAGLSLYITPNGDSTGANYSVHALYANGTAAYSNGTINTGVITAQQVLTDSSAGANMFGVGIVDILDYTSTTKNKTFRILAGQDTNSANGRLGLYSGFYINSIAINQLQINTDGSLVAGSRVDLYGITSSQVTGA